MSTRRKHNEIVWKIENAGFCGHPGLGIIPPHSQPEGCLRDCGDPECIEWSDVWACDEEGRRVGGTYCHVSECQMKTLADLFLPCPFCGDGNVVIEGNGRMWSGRGLGEAVSFSIIHRCPLEKSQPARRIERVGRDLVSAIEAWNRRSSLREDELQQQLSALDMEYGYAKQGIKDLKREITPILINEQAKDGRMYFVLRPYQGDNVWVCAKYCDGGWVNSEKFRITAPTHYLPLPLPEVVG